MGRTGTGDWTVLIGIGGGAVAALGLIGLLAAGRGRRAEPPSSVLSAPLPDRVDLPSDVRSSVAPPPRGFDPDDPPLVLRDPTPVPAPVPVSEPVATSTADSAGSVPTTIACGAWGPRAALSTRIASRPSSPC